MSQDPDESGIVPADHSDDGLLVRPYFAPSGPPPQPTAPSWPQTGPHAFPGPARSPDTGAPASAPDPAFAPAAVRGVVDSGRGRGGSRLPLAVITLLALAAAGVLVLVLDGSDPEPPRAEPPAELSVPVLPARSPGADGEPGPTASVRSAAPSPTGASAAPTSRGPKPTSSASASATPPSGAYVTLRMGDSGPEVRALQEMLFGQGFTYVSVTGVYDGQTKRGVSQLQRDRSIKGDPPGVYGPATQAAME